jgi:hypothetical protein
MPKLYMDRLERIGREFENNGDGTAIYSLCHFIRSEKHKGRRLLFHNGDQLIEVLRPFFAGGPRGRLIPNQRRILMPNSSLVLSDTMAENESNRPVYVGDKNWYVGAAALANALASEAGAALTIVCREEAAEIVQETNLNVRELIVSVQEY